MKQRCDAPSPWGTACLLPDEREHLDHLDDQDRTWINEAIVRSHDRRKYGDPLTQARQIAARAKPATTSRYARLKP